MVQQLHTAKAKNEREWTKELFMYCMLCKTDSDVLYLYKVHEGVYNKLCQLYHYLTNFYYEREYMKNAILILLSPPPPPPENLADKNMPSLVSK